MKSNLILQPVISEKSYRLANAMNKYVFLVDVEAEKVGVAKEVEEKFKVKVLSVNMVTRPGKMGRIWKLNKKYRNEDAKKAIVTLKKGDKIEEFLKI